MSSHPTDFTGSIPDAIKAAILEKIPDAINIPNQAVFEKDGKQIVYVRADHRWQRSDVRCALWCNGGW